MIAFSMQYKSMSLRLSLKGSSASGIFLYQYRDLLQLDNWDNLYALDDPAGNIFSGHILLAFFTHPFQEHPPLHHNEAAQKDVVVVGEWDINRFMLKMSKHFPKRIITKHLPLCLFLDFHESITFSVPFIMSSNKLFFPPRLHLLRVLPIFC